MISKRIGVEDGNKKFEDYKWIIPFSYESNLEDFGETFILNRTHCKYSYSISNISSVLISTEERFRFMFLILSILCIQA